MNRPLILASTSRYRQELLGRLGVSFSAEAPECDEAQWRHLPPEEQARVLAVRKAESIGDAGRKQGALIIGSDQVLDLAGTVLGKPGTEDAAIGQLLALRGRTHRLITAVAVHEPTTGRTEVATDVHVLTMRALSPEAIAAYVKADAPLDCCGSYRLEGRGIALFERIEADPETADDTAIVGLPLMKLCRLLRAFDYDVIGG